MSNSPQKLNLRRQTELQSPKLDCIIHTQRRRRKTCLVSPAPDTKNPHTRTHEDELTITFSYSPPLQGGGIVAHCS